MTVRLDRATSASARGLSRHAWRRLALTALVIAIPRITTAQPAPVAIVALRPSTDPVAARTDTLLAAGDTTGALKYLESQLFPHSSNAAAWYRYGVLQWSKAAPLRNGGYINDAKTVKALQKADSALRLATQFARDSAEYWATLARFNLQSGVGSMRFAAQQQMANALAAATRAGDSAQIAESADELGMATWRRYESTRNRALVGTGQHAQLQTDGRWSRAHGKDYLATFAKKIQPPTGADDYANAMEQFRTAARTAPTALRYSRHLYMGLAGGNQWEALLTLATKRAASSPFDADARLARGLSLQRLHRIREAKAAFDSALQLMDDAEVGHLFRIDRILPTGANVLTGQRGMDQASFVKLPAAQRETMSALFWTLNDPQTETAENEAQLEFMARVVHADWQWSDALQGVRGVDTDRGDIFVRYGPPDDEMTIPGISSVTQDVSASGKKFEGGTLLGGMSSTSQDVGSTIAWIYNSGEVFFFDVAPGFGTARTPLTDQKYVAEVGSVKPAAWENLLVPRRVDSLPVRAVRFRANGDSTDVVIITRLPVRALVADTASALDSAAVDGTLRTDLAIIDGTARTVTRDSTRTPLSKDALTRDAQRSWVRRVGAGAAFVRLDAVHQDAHSDAQRAASATIAIDASYAIGFTLSDVLLTRALASAPSASAPSASAPSASAARWRDLNVTPNVGEYDAGENIGLAWEIYDLAADASANRYRLNITIERIKRGGAAAIAVRVLDGLGALLKQGRGTNDQLSLAFDRGGPAKPVQVEFLTLDWLGESRGDYRLRVDVTDLVANRTSRRETRFRIR